MKRNFSTIVKGIYALFVASFFALWVLLIINPQVSQAAQTSLWGKILVVWIAVLSIAVVVLFPFALHIFRANQSPQNQAAQTTNYSLLIGILVILPGLLMVSVFRKEMRGVLFFDESRQGTTEATIIESSLYRKAPSHRSNGSWQYIVKFRFHHKDKTYVSNLIDFNWVRGYDDVEPVQNIVNTYRVGTKVRVYFDKLDPSFAVIDPSEKGSTPILLAIAAACIAGGVLAILHPFSKKFNAEDTKEALGREL